MSAPFSIIGHEEQRTSLQRDLDSGNVGHAYLFSGPRHVGKLTVAKWFALQLLSRDGGESDHTAEQMQKLLHPDLLVLDQLWIEDLCEDADEIAKTTNVSQEHRRKAKAKTDTIGIDDVRLLQDRLIETGTGTYRCCLIRSVERMQTEAVNALLKILEEPPAGVVFLLTTESQASLLPTLVSRTRVLLFPRLSAKALQPLTQGMDDEDAHFLLRLAQGAPGVVTRFRTDHEAFRVEQTAYAAARSFWSSRSLSERLKILSPLSKRDRNADRLLLHLALALRDSPYTAESVASLGRLTEGLQTNVSGQLLAQRFVYELSA